MAGCCSHGDELLFYVKCGEVFFDLDDLLVSQELLCSIKSFIEILLLEVQKARI